MPNQSFPTLKKSGFNILQVNLGYKCNQTCTHCHVNASPSRTEMMDNKNINLVTKVLEKQRIKILDLTGGAPEMHPRFKDLIIKASELNVEIIDRCNLTILMEPGYEDLPTFLASKRVKIIASLPCYLKSNVDTQRGQGTFEKSILAIKELNKLGYGRKDSPLTLDLVYNPQGPNLPPSQKDLEDTYHYELMNRYEISFNKLIVITNMPINRFSNHLKQNDELQAYMKLLRESYNPDTLDHLMCKNTISVDWKGRLFDCDFNQQIGLDKYFQTKTLNSLAESKVDFQEQRISTDSHCFGCTAGSGSSCSGALIT